MYFTHLHVHSHYSLLAGANSPAMLCRRAKELGYKALALTDTNNLSGALNFSQAAKAAGIRPIFGVQLTRSLPYVWGESYALVLARDALGFSELCQLTSDRQLKKEFDLVAALGAASSHIVIIASDMKLGLALTRARKRSVFVEIADLSPRGQSGKMQLKVQQASGCGLPCIVTNAVYFLHPEDHATHGALRAIDRHTSLAGLPENQAVPEQGYLKSTEEMGRRFAWARALLERTQNLAELCRGELPAVRSRFPTYPCPQGENEFTYLTRLCFAGLHKRYRPTTPEAVRCLAQELEVIEKKHFSGYFLTVWDIAREARRRGIPTVGRGSAANSIVSYCLSITHVDPLKHGLFFERFLNPEREDPPDIDLDFPWDQRDEMLGYAYARFGNERVAMICTTICLHGRSAVREAGRVLGLTEREISGFTRRLPYWGGVEDIEKAKARIPEARTLPLDEEPWRSVLFLAKRLEGVPRHLSVHPGGIVIAPCAVNKIMPTEMSTKGVVVTQYDMHAVEDAGFVKIDLLGQRGLAVIRDVGAAVNIDWAQVNPYADEPTKRLLREGRTVGCFYVESPATRLVLRKLKCDAFELLTAASSIIRPGVSNSGMMRMFVERHVGRQPVRYAHPRLKPLLQDTYGVMVYQEDVIKVVHGIAGMSLGEADKLRRCMSKKRHWEKMDTYRERFFEGAQKRGVPLKACREIWRQIEAFGGYAFCKAHSASYAQLSFQSAYLKAHYPEHFMAAVLSNQGGFYAPAVYLEEARRLGIGLLMPDINRSQWCYGVEQNKIRVGLLAVTGMSRQHADALVAEREVNGAYRSVRDLMRRVPLTREEVKALIEAGACDGLGLARPRLFWELELAWEKNTDRAVRELPLSDELPLPRLCGMSPDEQLAHEFNRMRLSPRAHPLMLYRRQLSALAKEGTVAAADLHRYTGRRVRVYGWLVTWRRTKVHKTGEMMKFVTLEDWTDSFEVTFFPKAYREHGHKLFGHGPYVVVGVVDNDRGGITITAEGLENLGNRRCTDG